jgi:hypothetical protein
MAGVTAKNSKTTNVALIVPMNPQSFRAAANGAQVRGRYLKRT